MSSTSKRYTPFLTIQPDERSVMTYVAQYFHAFSQMDNLGNAVRRVGQFGQVMESVWKLENDYEQRVRKLFADVEGIQGLWTSSTFNGYKDARKQLQEFDTYKNTTVCPDFNLCGRNEDGSLKSAIWILCWVLSRQS